MRWRTWGLLLGTMGVVLAACGDDHVAGPGDAGPGNDAQVEDDAGGDDGDGGFVPLTARVLPTSG